MSGTRIDASRLVLRQRQLECALCRIQGELRAEGDAVGKMETRIHKIEESFAETLERLTPKAPSGKGEQVFREVRDAVAVLKQRQVMNGKLDKELGEATTALQKLQRVHQATVRKAMQIRDRIATLEARGSDLKRLRMSRELRIENEELSEMVSAYAGSHRAAASANLHVPGPEGRMPVPHSDRCQVSLAVEREQLLVPLSADSSGEARRSMPGSDLGDGAFRSEIDSSSSKIPPGAPLACDGPSAGQIERPSTGRAAIRPGSESVGSGFSELRDFQTWRDQRSAGLELLYETKNGESARLELVQDGAQQVRVAMTFESAAQARALTAKRGEITGELRDLGIGVRSFSIRRGALA